LGLPCRSQALPGQSRQAPSCCARGSIAFSGIIWAAASVSASPAVHLTLRAQRAKEAGLAGDVNTLVHQSRDDPRRRRLGKGRFVGDRDGIGRSASGRPASNRRQLQAPQPADVDAGQTEGSSLGLRPIKTFDTSRTWRMDARPFWSSPRPIGIPSVQRQQQLWKR
jgi:hypothetical protein